MDKKQRAFEKKIARVYAEANGIAVEKAEKYFKTFQTQYEAEKLSMMAKTGKYAGMSQIQAERTLKSWLMKIIEGKDWTAVRGDLAVYLAEADGVAAALTNSYLIDVFMDAASSEQRLLMKNEIIRRINPTFDIYNKEAVERLNTRRKLFPKLSENTTSKPAREWTNKYTQHRKSAYYTIAKPVKEWHEKQIQKAVQSAIIQGDSIPKLSDAIKNATKMSETQAIRAARTAMTGAENAGTYMRWEELDKKYGIQMEKEWISAHDNRTRDSHAEIDGERVPYDEPFSNDLMYPGDPNGDGSEVWNCRCSMRAIFKGINDE